MRKIENDHYKKERGSHDYVDYCHSESWLRKCEVIFELPPDSRAPSVSEKLHVGDSPHIVWYFPKAIARGVVISKRQRRAARDENIQMFPHPQPFPVDHRRLQGAAIFTHNSSKDWTKSQRPRLVRQLAKPCDLSIVASSLQGAVIDTVAWFSFHCATLPLCACCALKDVSFWYLLPWGYSARLPYPLPHDMFLQSDTLHARDLQDLRSLVIHMFPTSSSSRC